MTAPLHVGHKVAYLAGPMRGFPRYNFDAFHRWTGILRSLGFSIISPAEMDEQAGFDPDVDVPTSAFLHDAFRRDMNAIVNKCCQIVMLPGWEKSKLAPVEREVAIACGHEVYHIIDNKVVRIECETGETLESICLESV